MEFKVVVSVVMSTVLFIVLLPFAAILGAIYGICMAVPVADDATNMIVGKIVFGDDK